MQQLETQAMRKQQFIWKVHEKKKGNEEKWVKRKELDPATMQEEF